ncbi:MAG TPA: protein kinase, partial [Rhodanobacteraceae bacterium]|nr:protein kinase [Rhodanobacteraceae bacterium]
MNPRLAARWHELAPLLDAALEAPDAAARRSVCEGVADAELRALLQALLAHEDAPGFLDGDGGAYAARLIGEAPSVPTTLGPYRVCRLLGEGGSGSVFLGERELDGSVQRVALKLLRSGVHDAAERERFRRERRILARLQHPHIARLLDGGFSPAGVPWFALEYVDGEPITAWCDARRLDLDARLRLFASACEAVAYAHRQLIVHRDLKPANLLVDAQGAPHLLDFGIAKLLDPSERGDATRTQARRLTPAYAAPEQFDGGAVSTATDVYALGVLLHELLCGRRPEVAVDGSLRLPSASVAADPQREAHAAARGSSARALTARLRGDLDTLLLTALAPEPARRYAGADALAADVARYLAQRPLQARRAGAGYRLGKFLRRHRVAAIAALLLGLSVVVGVAATLRESARARAAAAEAAQQAARAGAARDFVLALFDGVSPDEARGREIGARELLERGEARLAETLAQQPALRVELASDLAAGWRQLGAYERAADRLEPLLPLDPGAAARRELGRVRAAQGRYDDAEALLREALARSRDAGEGLDLRLDLADVLSERGRQDAAGSETAAVEAALRAQAAPDRPVLARALATRGSIAFRAGDAAAEGGEIKDLAGDGDHYAATVVS